MKNFPLISCLALLLLLSSCATSYQYIDPSKHAYIKNEVIDSSVTVYYKYNMLKAADNSTKYTKKEDKFAVNLIGIKITNNSDSIVNTNQLEFYSNGHVVRPLNPKQTKKALRQRGEYHLLYLLLSSIVLEKRYYSGTTKIIPLGFFVGAGLTIINAGLANSANRDFYHNLNDYSIENKNVPPGQSVYCLAGFPTKKEDIISAKRKK